MQLSGPLFREALAAAREPLPLIKGLSYRALFGPEWRQALLGYAYIRVVDDLVDREPDAARALDVMRDRRRFLDGVYQRNATGPTTDADRYGAVFFSWDRDRGGHLRADVEAILGTIEFDSGRRGRVLTCGELDQYVLDTGIPFFRYMTYFTSGHRDLPLSCARTGSRAYLYADALMDLEEDLAVGIVNIPAEVVEELAIDLDAPRQALELWLPRRAVEIEELFQRGIREAVSIEDRSSRLLIRHYLRRKRRRFRRYLKDCGLTAPVSGRA